MWVIAQVHGDGFLLFCLDHGVVAFESRLDAEDYADDLDEPGEFQAIQYDESMGPMVVIV